MRRDIPCSFASCRASFDSCRLPPVMIIDFTPAAFERSSIAPKSSIPARRHRHIAPAHEPTHTTHHRVSCARGNVLGTPDP